MINSENVVVNESEAQSQDRAVGDAKFQWLLSYLAARRLHWRVIPPLRSMACCIRGGGDVYNENSLRTTLKI